jgi:hypothetical protein
LHHLFRSRLPYLLDQYLASRQAAPRGNLHINKSVLGAKISDCGVQAYGSRNPVYRYLLRRRCRWQPEQPKNQPCFQSAQFVPSGSQENSMNILNSIRRALARLLGGKRPVVGSVFTGNIVNGKVCGISCRTDE